MRKEITKKTMEKIVKNFENEFSVKEVIEKTYDESIKGFDNHFCLNLKTEEFEVINLTGNTTLNSDFLVSIYVIGQNAFQEIDEDEDEDEDELEYFTFWAEKNGIEFDLENELMDYVK